MTEVSPRRKQHVHVNMGHRSKAAAQHDHILLVQIFRGLHDATIGPKHSGFGKPVLHQLKGHQAVVDMAEVGAIEPEHVNFSPSRTEAIEERKHDLLGIGEKHTGVNQIYAQNTQRHLLLQGVIVVHLDVNHTIIEGALWCELKPDAHPALALVGTLKIQNLNGISEGKEAGLVNPVW